MCDTNYPLDAEVNFANTESFTVLGDTDKSSVRSDLVAEIKTTNEHTKLSTEKVIIELQSSKDKEMGFRMLVYSLNLLNEPDENIYTFPRGVTIYTTLDLPKEEKTKLI